MPTSAWIGRANIRRFADGIFQYLATLSLYGAKIGDRIGKKSTMTERMHRRRVILSFGASLGEVDLGILLWPMLIATKKTYATRIRTADAEVPKVQAWTPSRTASAIIAEWLGGFGGWDKIYRHDKSRKNSEDYCFCLQ